MAGYKASKKKKFSHTKPSYGLQVPSSHSSLNILMTKALVLALAPAPLDFCRRNWIVECG
jgi:hypothetical protein